MSSEKCEVSCHMAMTIEKKLKAYSECVEATERHKILWNEWSHNKRCLTRIQELIFSSFPSYSMHDSTHSEAVLHNIEMILGEDVINCLSATDCFLLLHTVYIHDIGMCITDEDRKDIIRNPKFIQFVKSKISNGDHSDREYAKLLIGKFSDDTLAEETDVNMILEKNLNIYYAITHFLADYRRTDHGEKSKERLLSWINSSDKLNSGFSTVEIPKRLFFLMADCAATHTKWGFDNVLDLCKEDLGYAHDYVHPRFVAVLLQLGDALDMDNNRFHPLVEEFNGKMPKASQIHFRKHESIRHLRITNQKIEISADCKSQEELRIIREECDGIQRILEKATYYWAVIKPSDLNVSLPTFENIELLLNGKAVPKDLVMAKFQISQNKAFNIIQGDNIYSKTRFVFLRELIQNASDASKLAYWRECVRKYNFKKRYEDNLKSINSASLPADLNKLISPEEFGIIVELSIVGREKANNSNIIEINPDKVYISPEENKIDIVKYEYGVLVKVSDFATGITQQEIKEISDVGSSFKAKETEIATMPSWLKPTSEFGIGLQSVFLVDSKFEAITHARNGEKYHIVFNARTNNGDGSINVTPINGEGLDTYGTCFEVFVSYNHKLQHKDSMESWTGKDPFGERYDLFRPIRHSEELIKQMTLYIEDMLEEVLFPVTVKITHEESKENEQDQQVRAWFYDMDNAGEMKGDILGKGLYYFDTDKAKLYVWDKKHNTCACFGGKRFVQMSEQSDVSVKKGIPIYYKGIYAENILCDRDAGVLEYMDIKGLLNRENIKLNRNGFTDNGKKLIKEKIYPSILKLAQDALKLIALKASSDTIFDLKIIEDKIKKMKEDANKRRKLAKNIHEQIISASVLAYFALLRPADCFISARETPEENKWDKLLEKLSNIIKENNNGRMIYDSLLYRIPYGNIFKTEEYIKGHVGTIDNILNIAEFFRASSKYAILSVRTYHDGEWEKYLFRVADEVYTDIEKEIESIEKSMDLWKDSNEKLEKISDDFIKPVPGIVNQIKGRDSTIYNNEIDAIFEWMLENVPTMTSFANEDENQRWNVLSSKFNDSIYVNSAIKRHIIQKMIKTYAETQIERFSTLAWTGYSSIGLKAVRNSIHFVKRGKFAPMCVSQVVFPLNGCVFDKLHSISEDEHLKQLENEILWRSASVFKSIEEYLLKLGHGFLYDKYFKVINDEFINSSTNMNEIPGAKLNLDCIYRGLEANEDTDDYGTNKANMKNEVIEFVIPTIKVMKNKLEEYQKRQKETICKMVDESWNENIKAKENLISYVSSANNLDFYKVELLYEAFITEIVELLCDVYSDPELSKTKECLKRINLKGSVENTVKKNNTKNDSTE